jgi:uncharacterized ion transporter superfamily protein YfcC
MRSLAEDPRADHGDDPSMTRSRFPHPITLLTACIFLAALMSWVLPAGQFDRATDEATGRSIVVPGSYHEVEATPVGPFDAFVAIPRGMAEAGDIIFLVFLIGGAFIVVEQTGTFGRAVQTMITRFGKNETLIIYLSCALFCLGGVLYNMHEEIVALVPVLLILCKRLGYDAKTAVAMSLGAAVVGSSFSPINPFAVRLAQDLAGLEPVSGWLFRSVVLLIALGFWMWYTARHARRVQVEKPADSGDAVQGITGADGLVLGLVAVTFAVMVYGTLERNWGFNEMSGLFFGMGILAGLIGGLRVSGTALAFVQGFKEMAFAGILIGFARAIYVVLNDGGIVDTLVYGLFTPLEGLPPALSALGMMAGQALVHLPVSSNSGQAVLTLPILVPLSDLLEISRQVTVMAYQYGGAMGDIIVPTNGGLMAVLFAAGVSYDEWIKFILKPYLVIFGIGAAALLAAMAMGIS